MFIYNLKTESMSKTDKIPNNRGRESVREVEVEQRMNAFFVDPTHNWTQSQNLKYDYIYLLGKKSIPMWKEMG